MIRKVEMITQLSYLPNGNVQLKNTLYVDMSTKCLPSPVSQNNPNDACYS